MTSLTSADLSLVGGHMALDFVNTVWWHEAEEPHEWLASYDDLLAWSVHADVMTEAQAAELARVSRREPVRADETLKKAIELREALFRIFRTLISNRRPSAADVAVLNQVVRDGLSHVFLHPIGPHYEWAWEATTALEFPSRRIACAAAQLLVSQEAERIGMCAGSPCGWLFLDRSRSRSRRWCDMKDCGNRAKARRHYQRHKRSGRPPSQSA